MRVDDGVKRFLIGMSYPHSYTSAYAPQAYLAPFTAKYTSRQTDRQTDVAISIGRLRAIESVPLFFTQKDVRETFLLHAHFYADKLTGQWLSSQLRIVDNKSRWATITAEASVGVPLTTPGCHGN